MSKLLAVLTVLGLGACGPGSGTAETGPPDPGPPLTVVGSLVLSVDESEVPPEVLEEAVGDEPLLVITTAERDALSEALGLEPPGLVSDLTTHLLVAGSYPRCTEASRILLDSYRNPPGLTFSVHDPEPGTVCAWSPLTVDVWAVPRADLGDQEPELVPLRTGPGR